MMLKRLMAMLVVSLVLTACGFHLRGKLPLSDNIKVIAVISEDSEIRERIIEALNLSGATVVPSAEANAELDFYFVKFERRVRTIDSRGKVTGYVLEYQVQFKVTDASGDELRNSNLIIVRRDFNFDPNQVLQKEDEEEALLEDMITELTQRVMRQLSTIALVAPANSTLGQLA